MSDAQGAPLLLDTQAVIRWAKDDVPAAVVRAVTRSRALRVSVVSFWEFILKTRYNQVGLEFDDFHAVVSRLGAKILDIKILHLKTLEKLPFVEDHRDPFDRLILSQALAENLTVVGSDRRFPSYRRTKFAARLKLLWE